MNLNSFVRLFLLFALLTTGILSGCKKDKTTKPAEDPAVTAANLSKDTMYYLFKDEYYFTQNIPAYNVVNPRASANLDSLFNKMVRYQTNPVDKYSYRDPTGYVASVIGQGQSQGDFGIDIWWNSLTDLRVVDVKKGSPADLLWGIKRGWQITSINGNTNVTYDGSQVSGSSTNFNRIYSAVYSSSSTTFIFQKPDGTSVTVPLNSASYTINPITLDSVYTFGSRKIGYLVFGSFIDLSNIQTLVDAAFNKFQNNNITDLIVDLRYNGGGSVETSEYFANLIAPTGIGTALMYKYLYNTNMTTGNYSAFTNQTKTPYTDMPTYADLFNYFPKNYTSTYFSKKGSINLNNVIFLVTGGTASASELLINNLTPHMPVTIIGQTTYGKPFGFFPVTVGGVDMYVISMKSVNSAGNGDYYNGMTPDISVQYEDFSKDYGQIDEPFLYQALVKLGVKSLPIVPKAQKASIANFAKSKFNRGFKGMIETRMKKLIR
jgi:C-terminal processing protease CtpA/Prc